VAASSPDSIFLASSTVNVSGPPPPPNRIEFPTSTVFPPFTTATGTGAVPTVVARINACPVSVRSFSVSKVNTWLLARDVTYNRSPFGETAARTASHPAGVFATTVLSGFLRRAAYF
jgi:hypothetical protein